MSKNVLIAGGTGFLGSHLADYYISTKNKVIIVDNLSTSSEQNIAHLLDEADFSFVQHDITENFPEEISNQKFDVIVNLASPASPPHYQRLGLETLKVGSVGTLNLLELAKASGARFFHASTSEVYGDPEIHPQTESYRGSVNPYGPRSMYDEAKRYAEALIYTFRKKYHVSTCVGRFFNTYGPRMDANDGRVVSNFIVQALQDKDITIYGDGTQTRSFCYVEDLINAIVACIESDIEGPINLGNDGEFTVRELAQKVIELTNSGSKITYLPLPGDDPTQRKPDLNKKKKEIY